MIIHYGDIHFNRLFQIAYDCKLALIYLNIRVFFERKA